MGTRWGGGGGGKRIYRPLPWKMRKGVFSYVESHFATFSPFGGFFAIRQEKMAGEVVGEGVGEKGMSGSRKSILIY